MIHTEASLRALYERIKDRHDGLWGTPNAVECAALELVHYGTAAAARTRVRHLVDPTVPGGYWEQVLMILEGLEPEFSDEQPRCPDCFSEHQPSDYHQGD